MTDSERDAILERIGDMLILSLETAAENIAAVVAGEKRLALVPRKHPKVKEGLIQEFRLVTPPQVKLEEPQRTPNNPYDRFTPGPDGWKPDEAELDEPPIPAESLAPGQSDDNTRYDRDQDRDDPV